MMLIRKLITCNKDGKTKKKESFLQLRLILLLKKEKQVWAVLTDFIFVSSIFMDRILMPSVSNAAVEHEIKKFYVVVVRWRERNAPNSVMHVQSFANALKESSL